jgi:acid stress chaperone HdeA
MGTSLVHCPPTRQEPTRGSRIVGRCMVPAAIIAVLLGTGACAKAGADTTCKDYVKMSQSDQESQVSKLYKDKHGDDPSGLILTGLQQEALAYCNTAGHSDSKIKEIPLS